MLLVTERSCRDRPPCPPSELCPFCPTQGPQLSYLPTNRTRQGPSFSCTALESESSSTGLGCHGKPLQSSSFSTSTRPCRVITSPCGSNTMRVGMPARERERAWPWPHSPWDRPPGHGLVLEWNPGSTSEEPRNPPGSAGDFSTELQASHLPALNLRPSAATW